MHERVMLNRGVKAGPNPIAKLQQCAASCQALHPPGTQTNLPTISRPTKMTVAGKKMHAQL
jgi:hypothetical protein